MLLKQKDYRMGLKSYRIKTYVHSYDYVTAFLNTCIYLAACLQVDKISLLLLSVQISGLYIIYIVLFPRTEVAFLADVSVAIGSPCYSIYAIRYTCLRQ